MKKGLILRSHRIERIRFRVRQAIRLTTAALMIIGLVSIWFDDPTRLATALGLVTAGMAFAFQKVLTAVVGYFVILRGKIFNVGDRIVMGSVRGDVIVPNNHYGDGAAALGPERRPVGVGAEQAVYGSYSHRQ